MSRRRNPRCCDSRWPHRTAQRCQLELHPFASSDGEVLLLLRTLSATASSTSIVPCLVGAHDVQLIRTDHGQVRPRGAPPRVAAPAQVTNVTLCGTGPFEAPMGHQHSVLLRYPFGYLKLSSRPARRPPRRASRERQVERFAHVHADPELEADVFEQRHDDQQSQLMRSRSN